MTETAGLKTNSAERCGIPNPATGTPCVARTAHIHHRDEMGRQWPNRGTESPTFTAAEVKVLTETVSKVAYALGRKDAGEEIATAINVARIQHHWNVVALAAAGECARIAREVVSQEPQDASEPRTDPERGTSLPPELQAVRSPQGDANG